MNISDLHDKKLEDKFFLLGFLIGISPYLLIIGFAVILDTSKSFRTILLIFMIITGLVNGYIFKNWIKEKRKKIF